MSCERWLPALTMAADDEPEAIPFPERHALSAHLAGCEECRRALEEQKAVRLVLAARVDAPPPPGFADRVVASVAPKPRWIDALRWDAWTYRLAPLAAGLLVLGIVTARGAASTERAYGLRELTESWAFGAVQADSRPTFTVWGDEDLTGDALLDAVLSAEPDADPTEENRS